MIPQTIAEVFESPETSIVITKGQVLETVSGKRMTVLYICSRTGNFLASEELSSSKSINPLEYNKNGRMLGFSRIYDIKRKRDR